MRRRRATGSIRATSCPWIRTRPVSGDSRPFTSFSTVVFPQPDRPMIDTNAPGSTSKEKSRRTVWVPKALETPSKRMIGWVISRLQQALLEQEVPGRIPLVPALHLHLVVERGHLPV